MADSTESRERFEKEFSIKGFDLDWDGESYEDIETDAAWRGWQAAEADTRARCALAVQEKE